MAQKFEFRLHITGPEVKQDYIVPIGETMIGRDPSNTLPLVYPLVSRRHAVILCSELSCTITDLDSANGTLVDGTRLESNQPHELADQMKITIGPFEILCTMTEITPVQEAAPPEAEEPKEDEAEAKPVKAKPAKKTTKPSKAEAEKAEKPDDKSKKPEGDGPPPVEPPAEGAALEEPDPYLKPIPGLDMNSQRLINYLPGIYMTDFMSRFLGMFEAILTPIEWNVDNFDLFLDPGTAPRAFLPWLANWYQISFDPTWTETQRRTLLSEANQIYARRGTRWALSRLLEIYTGSAPEIVEFSDPQDPFTFTIKLPIRERDVNRQLLEQLIDSSKPSQTSYELEFRG